MRHGVDEDVAGILHEERIEVDWGVGVDVIQLFVDLGIGGHVALAEGFDSVNHVYFLGRYPWVHS